MHPPRRAKPCHQRRRGVEQGTGQNDQWWRAVASLDFGHEAIMARCTMRPPPLLSWRYDRGYTPTMKTAISLPDDVFEAADELAAKLGVSRSQLYARAVAQFVAQQSEDDVTARLNAIYGESGAVLDPELQDLQSYSVAGDPW